MCTTSHNVGNIDPNFVPSGYTQFKPTKSLPNTQIMLREINQIYRMVDTWRKMAYPDQYKEKDWSLEEILERQYHCLKEEVLELTEASRQNVTVDIVDGICDVVWVAMMMVSIGNTVYKDTDKVVRLPLVYTVNEGKLSDLLTASLSFFIQYDNTLSGSQYGKNFSEGDYSRLLSDIISYGYTYLYQYGDGLRLFNEVIVSNYSKAIDGQLLLDDTNKVTKKPAIDAGSYVKPDFTVYLK